MESGEIWELLFFLPSGWSLLRQQVFDLSLELRCVRFKLASSSPFSVYVTAAEPDLQRDLVEKERTVPKGVSDEWQGDIDCSRSWGGAY